jgi:lysophospholipase L1-like esterase
MAGLAAAATTAASAGVAEAASSVRYVALGDSYSSGVGAGSYSDGSCDQSAKSFPVLWADANGPASFANETCSGATTSTVLSSQLGALSGSTTLVSITVGGNDVGFTNVMVTCVLFSTSSCVSAVDTAESQAKNTLPGELNGVLSAIRSDAPSAKVVVLDYPQFYDLARSSGCIGLSTTDRTDLNQGAGILDGVIQAAAARYGDTFVDVNPHFSGHQICDSDSYLNSVDWLDIGDSYHPNAQGQADGYLPAFESAAG